MGDSVRAENTGASRLAAWIERSIGRVGVNIADVDRATAETIRRRWDQDALALSAFSLQHEDVERIGDSAGNPSRQPYTSGELRLLFVQPRLAAKRLMHAANHLRHLETKGFTLRFVPPKTSGSKGERAGERIDILESLTKLAVRLVALGCAPFLSEELRTNIESEVRRNPHLAYTIATGCFNLADDDDSASPRVKALARAVEHIFVGLNQPMAQASLGLAHSLFSLANRLRRVVAELEDQHAIHPELANVVAYFRQEADWLRTLELEIRRRWTSSPRDAWPRGMTGQPLLLGATQMLHDGGWTEGEIATLLDDGMGGTATKRVERIRAALNRKGVHSWRTRYVRAHPC
jgi:hypothetical protein